MIKAAEKAKVAIANQKRPSRKRFRKGSIEAIEASRGLWAGPDEEVDRLLAQVAQLRETGTIRKGK